MRHTIDDESQGSSRRTFLRRTGLALAATAAGEILGPVYAAAVRFAPARDSRSGVFAYVGSLTSRERQGRGEGISVFRVDALSGAWSHVQTVAGEVNPSFLVADPVRPFLFASHSDGGIVSAFRIDAGSGRLALINRQETGGPNPAHVALAPSGRFVLAANYGGGSVAVIRVGDDGRLGERTNLVEMKGELGPRRPEQSASHPHQCRFCFGGRVVAVPDLGLDRIFLFILDEPEGRLRKFPPADAEAAAGSGPRHVDFHDPVAYVANELDSTLAVYKVDDSGRWTKIQVAATVPPGFNGTSTAAEVEVSRSGRLLFVSNRGHDSIVTYPIDARTGMLGTGQWVPCGGKTPRFFCQDPSGGRLCVANQATDTIVAFSIDPRTGALEPAGPSVDVGTPTAIAFAGASATGR